MRVLVVVEDDADVNSQLLPLAQRLTGLGPRTD